MQEKKRRHAKIIELIENNEIQTQGEIVAHLQAAGFDVTQATVSRDIKDLRLIKVSKEGGAPVYTQSHNTLQLRFNEKLTGIFSNSVISIAHAGNIIVVKTLSGAANAAASAIDSIGFEEVLGSIAGDDTIMIVTKNEKDCRYVCSRLSEMR